MPLSTSHTVPPHLADTSSNLHLAAAHCVSNPASCCCLLLLPLLQVLFVAFDRFLVAARPRAEAAEEEARRRYREGKVIAVCDTLLSRCGSLTGASGFGLVLDELEKLPEQVTLTHVIQLFLERLEKTTPASFEISEGTAPARATTPPSGKFCLF